MRCWNAPADIDAPMTRRRLFLGLKLGISAVLLGWLLVRFDFTPVLVQLQAMKPVWLAAAFLMLMLHGFTSAWRWWAIMRRQGDAPGYGPTLQLFFIGMFFNQTLSTTLGGDAARVWLLRATGVSTGRAATGVVLERAAGMLSMMALIPAAILAAPLTGQKTWWLLTGAGVALAAIIGFGPALRSAGWRWLQGLGSFLYDARRVLLSRAGIPILLLSLGIHLGGGLTVWLVAMAANASPGLLVCLTLSPLALLLATLPISFGGWGVREAVLVGLFVPYGIATEQALGVSITLGLLVMLAGLPGGALWLIRGRTPRAAPIPPG